MIIYAGVPKSKKRKQVSKAKREQYENWLKSHAPVKVKNLHKLSAQKTYEIERIDHKNIRSLDVEVLGALTKSGIMKDFHKLSENDRKIVDHLSKCVAPLHKSSYVYVSEGMNPAGFGRKNEVL
jgi:hypothetical protein